MKNKKKDNHCRRKKTKNSSFLDIHSSFAEGIGWTTMTRRVYPEYFDKLSNHLSNGSQVNTSTSSVTGEGYELTTEEWDLYSSYETAKWSSQMIELIKNRKTDIEAACRKYNVARLDVFGSALRDDYSDKSDIDLLVTFEDMQPGDLADAYFGLLNDLRSILGKAVDLVMSDAIRNKYIAEDIKNTKQALYAA